MGELGVTEWENLGYRDSDMMGRRGQQRPADVLAGRPRRGRPPPDVADPALPARRRHDLQRVRRLRPPRPHPGPRRRDPGRSPRAGDPTWYPEQLEDGPRAVDAEEALRDGDARPPSGAMNEAWPRLGRPTLLAAAEGRDARAARRVRGVRMAKMLVPDESDHDLDRHRRRPLDRKWAAIQSHVTQINDGHPLHDASALDGWSEFWAQGGVHPPRVDGRDREARVGPLRRPRLRADCVRRGWATARREPERPLVRERGPRRQRPTSSGATAVHQGSPFDAS